MYSQKLTLLTVYTFLHICVFSQTTKKSIKSSPQAQLEIDKLYSKYKNLTSTTIYFPGGKIQAKVSSDLNEKDKPMEISLHNEVDDIEGLSTFLSYYIKQKLKSGFRGDGNTFFNTDWERESIRSFLDDGPSDDEKVVVLTKGKEYSKILYRKCKKEYSAVHGGFITVTPCFFSISTGDMRRVGNGNTTDFKF